MAFDITETLISIATLLIFSQITIAELVGKPTDTETLVGDLTYFNCSTSVVSQAIQWFHFPLAASGDREIVYGYNQFYGIYKDRFAIEVNEAAGTYNLVIRSVQVQDAGRYECQDDVGRGEKASALLIVIDQSPLCQSNDKSNEVIGSNGCDIPVGELQFTCSATYHGDAAPVLKWFQDGSDQPLVDSPSSSGSRSQSNLTLKADSIKDGSSFHCRATRSKTTSYSCTSGPVKIIGNHGQTCPSTKPYVDTILVICLFMIPIIIAASVVGGIYLENRFKIFDRLVGLKGKDEVSLRVEADPILEEDVGQKTDVTKDVERLVLLENNVKTQEQQLQQYELLKKRILELAKSSDEDKRKIGKLEQIARHEKRKLEEERVKWEEEKRELEERLYPSAIASYSDKPKLVSVIDIKTLKADSKKEMIPIFGMTILRNKLFVVTEKSSAIEVYDSITFNPEPSWPIANMSNPMDIASCRTKNCLYVFNGEPHNEILRIDSGKTLLKWSIEGDLGHLSVARDGNVVVSLFNGNKIMEYSPDGQLIRTVRLSPADNISHPWHAIKTTGMHFIFSHGMGDDPLQRVCVANADGKILKSFGGRKGKETQQMNRPVYLLEDSSRNVLVADMKNKRLLLLSPTLEYKRTLVSADTTKLRFPMRLCLDEERGILFVGDNNYKEGVCTYDSGRILIFNCKT